MSGEKKKGSSGRRRGQKRGPEGEEKEKEKEMRDLPPPEELEAMVKGPEDESFEAWKQAAGEADQEEAEPDIMEEDVPPAKKRKGEGKASRAKRSSAAGPSAPPPSPEKVEKDGLQLLGEAVDRKMDEELSGTMATAKFILGALREHAARAAMATETGSQGDVTNLELVRAARPPPSGDSAFSGARQSLMLERAVSSVLCPALFEIDPSRFPPFMREALRGDKDALCAAMVESMQREETPLTAFMVPVEPAGSGYTNGVVGNTADLMQEGRLWVKGRQLMAATPEAVEECLLGGGARAPGAPTWWVS